MEQEARCTDRGFPPVHRRMSWANPFRKIRLQRVTTSGRWIPEVDGLRFVAIAAVILGHNANPLLSDPRFGWLLRDAPYGFTLSLLAQFGRGVQLFFMISGFILAQPFLRQHVDGGKKVSLSSFYLRRLTRLEPPYILSLLIYGIAVSLYRGANHHDIPLSVAESMLYVHNFFTLPAFVNPVTWSLEIEIQFYLIAPLVALLFLIRPTGFRRIATVAAILLSSLICKVPVPALQLTIAPWFCFFLIGFLVADLRLTDSTARPGFQWDILALAAWAAYFLLLRPGTSNATLCVTLFCCFAFSMLGPVSRRLLRVRWVALLGGMCYSFYLMHSLIIHGLYSITKHAMVFTGFFRNYLVALLLNLGPVLVLSVSYYILIERPCMDPHWPRRLRTFITGLAGTRVTHRADRQATTGGLVRNGTDIPEGETGRIALEVASETRSNRR